MCGERKVQSGPMLGTGYEINRRVVFGMRILGVAPEGLNIFCNLMNISAGLSQSAHDKIVRYMHTAATTVFEKFTKKAAEEEKAKNIENSRPENDFKVSGDGSWKKQGFTSLYGVTTILGYYTGKVLDSIVKSSFCTAFSSWGEKEDTIEYSEWYENHQESCSQNHQGSAEKMEVDSIIEMFNNSEKKFGVKYLNYIGDGDLSRDDLLIQCLGVHTQNANESFNATVWCMNPKHLNSGKKIVDIATFLATGIFNEGYTSVLTTMELLDLRIGQQCKAFVDQADKQRVERVDQRYSTSTKEARSVKKEA